MKQISDFARRFGAEISLDESLIVTRQHRYFLVNEDLKKLLSKGFFYAGTYLGRIKNDVFFPSFNLIRMIAESQANKTVVDERTEWLFICGRDIFKRGITKVIGSKKKGDLTLILNRHGECLGFGEISHNLDEEREGLAIENILDIGDFLRREK